MQEKYPDGINEEQVIYEAKESMKPFTLEVERLDWWTQYK
jgi:phenol 2-monooxygenase